MAKNENNLVEKKTGDKNENSRKPGTALNEMRRRYMELSCKHEETKRLLMLRNVDIQQVPVGSQLYIYDLRSSLPADWMHKIIREQLETLHNLAADIVNLSARVGENGDIR